VQVEVCSSALTDSADRQLALLGILSLCYAGRHSLTGEPNDLLRWSERVHLREMVELILADPDASIGAPRQSLQVRKGPPIWSARPELPADVALTLLCQPLRVYLENGWTDRTALMAFASRAQRQTLEQAEARGWLLFLTAGGCGGVATLAEQLAPPAEGRRDARRRQQRGESEACPLPADAQLRILLFMDSDALHPDHEAETARRVRQALRSAGAALGGLRLGCVLKRREVENYIPLGKLENWATHETLKTVRALRKSPETVAWWYDMKHGRHSDVPKEARVDDRVWSLVPNNLRPALFSGIGEANCRRFFAEHQFLPDPSCEIADFISLIIERL
jgi:hypothetical protein